MDNALLEPISDDAPCGVDLAYEPVYNDLAVLIEGTPENQFETGSAKEPNWAEIRKLSEQSLKRSKDLQMGVYYTLALTKTSGIAGAADGLELIAGIVRKYWDTLFPNLDPDDKDPTQRVNILSQLTVEQGGYGDPVKFLERLNAAPIFRVPGLAVTMEYLQQDGAAKLPELVGNANAEEVAAGVEALRRCASAVHATDDFLIATVSRSSAPSFDPLLKTLDKGLRWFDALTPPSAEAPAGEAGEVAGTASAGAPRQGISGEIRSLDDVRSTLKKIRTFYAANEPSSPVPLLLLRAERLVGKDFLELLTNLTPSARSDFEALMGPQPEET